MKKNPKVGVIVLTYNSAKDVVRCLASIQTQQYESLTSYVVDNKSSDNTLNLVKKFPSVIVLQEKENRGYAGGNNRGIAQAFKDGCDVVLLVNPDAYLTSKTVSTLVDRVGKSSKKIGAAQPLILLHQEKNLINSAGNHIHYLGFGYAYGHKQMVSSLSIRTSDTVSIPYASGAVLFLTKEALTETGLFDEDFFLYHEDLDLNWRMRLKGWDVVLIPSATAFHDYSFSKSIQKYYYMERNRIMFLLKNFSLKYLLLILPMFLITEVGLDFFSLKSGFFKERLRAWVYFLKRKHWGPVIEARQHIQKNRIVSDRELLTYITDIIDFQDLDSEILTKVGNPLFRAYFRAIKPFI